MAEANIQVTEEQFKCSVCLDIFEHPVTIPCGHSFCMKCIENYWHICDQYRCPHCRQLFNQKPILGKNIILVEFVENFKKAKLNPRSYAGPGDVPCDFCTGRKIKAVKSCLTCLASYCKKHIKSHSEVAAFKRHKLVNAIANLEQKLCAEHHRVLDGFCRNDKTCICWFCTDKEHKSHDTVSAETEWIEIQEQLGETQTEIQQRIQKRLGEQLELNKNVELCKLDVNREVVESEKIFDELIQPIVKIRDEVIGMIRDIEKKELTKSEEPTKKLEQEIAELKRRNADLKQLSETEDHIHFLQHIHSVIALPEAEDIPGFTVNKDISFGTVRKATAELKGRIQDMCKGELAMITKAVNEVAVQQSLLPPEPMDRAELLNYSCELTLDPNTVNRVLWLHEGNRKVTWGSTMTQPYLEHPDRFDYWPQVLCKEGLFGTRCYWEIEWIGEGAYIGVTYKGISRKGDDVSRIFGCNDKSWSLQCSVSSYSACHNYRETVITAPRSPRIGVYLDCPAGTLSFYGVSDTMTLLHRFQATFTEPLYLGFGVTCNSTITILRAEVDSVF